MPTASTDRYSSKLSANSRWLRNDFVPDGNLAKRAWKTAAWVHFDHDWSGKRHYSRAATSVASRWTATQVYFAFRCKYSKLNIYSDGDSSKDKWGLWERDVVEVFANPEPERVDHYYEFEVAPNNLWIDLEIDLKRKPFNDASWNSGFQHATHVENGVWSCEMRIPVGVMTPRGYRLRSGSRWRVNLFRADGEGPDKDRRLLAWSPTLVPNFHVPTRFGILRFSK